MKTQILPVFLIIFLFAFQKLDAQLVTFDGTGGLPVPPGAPGQTVGITTSDAPVTGVGVLGGCVTIDHVDLNLQHTWDGDIAIFLIGPGGQVLELSSGNGGAGDNFTNTVFTDNTALFLPQGMPPFTGIFRPEGRQQNTIPPFPNGNPMGTFTFANLFNGTNADGNWTLMINDYVAADVGFLISWSITFNVGGAAPVADAGPDETICPGQTVALTANSTPPATGYNWSTGSTMQTINVSPLATTNYIVTVTANGCTDVDTVKVTVNPNGTMANAGPDIPICNGSNANLNASGGGPGASYTWSNGDSGPNINVSPSSTTNYTVTVNENGCTATDVVAVIVTPIPNANAGPDLSICSGTNAVLNASGGVGPNTYLWSTGQSGSSITVSPASATVYTVTVTINGCPATSEALVDVNPSPSVSVGSNVSICSGTSTVLDAVGSPGNYNWSNGASGTSITVAPAATQTYTVTVTANGCSTQDNVTVIVQQVSANAGSNVSICAGQSATLTATGGTMYQWSTGDTGPSISVTPGFASTYSVTVTNGIGCTGTDDVTVTIKPLPTANAGPDISICPGDVAALTATGGTLYHWDTGQNSAGINVAPLVSTNYSVTVTLNGCTDVDEVAVLVLPAPVAGAGTNVGICEGSEATLTASGGGSYQWNGGQNTATIMVAPVLNTTYTVTVTNASGCEDEAQVTVLVTPVPPADAGPDQTICQGETAQLSASGGNSYLWNNGQNVATIDVSPLATSTYSVTVSANGCSVVDQATVIVNTLPLANAGSNVSIVAGASATLTASGGGTYQWSTGDSGASISVSPATTTTYTVTVTLNGCTSVDAVTVSVNEPPVVDLGADQTICEGDTITLTAASGTIPGNTVFTWSNGATTPSIVVFPADTITYFVTATLNGLSNSDTITVFVNHVPIGVPAITGNPVVCSGTSTNYQISAVTGALGYTWSVPAGATIVSGQGTTAITVDWGAALSGNVQVLAFNNCGQSPALNQLVQINLPPAMPSPIAGNNAPCAASLLPYSIDSIPGAQQYNWTISGGTITAGQGAAGIQVDWNNTTGGQICVNAENACGSGADTCLTVTTTPVPTSQAGNDLDICGLNTGLNSTGSGIWMLLSGPGTAVFADTSSANSNVSVSQSGTYLFNWTVSSNDCTAVDSLSVVFHGTQSGNMSAAPLNVCAGDTATASYLGGAAFDADDVLGYALHTGVLPGGLIALSNSPSFVYDNTLAFSVTYYISAVVGSNDGNGLPSFTDQCLAYSQGTPVVFRPLPAVLAGSPPPLCAGDCTDVTFNFQGSGPFTLNYSDGTTNQTLNSSGNTFTQQFCPGATAAWPILSVSDAYCSNINVDTLNFTVNQPPTADIAASDEVCNTGASGFSTLRNFDDYVLAGSAGGNWTDVDNSGASGTFPQLDFSGVAPGIYHFNYTTATAQTPCANVSYDIALTVTDNCNCPPVALLPSTPICNAAAGSLSLSSLVAPGTPPGNWSIASTPGGSNPASISNNSFFATGATPGDYVLLYTLQTPPPGSCTPSSNLTITVVGENNAGIPLAAPGFCAGSGQTLVLSDLLNGENAGGIWSETSAQPSGAGAFDAASGTFTPNNQVPGTYQFQYLVQGQTGCPSASAIATVLVYANPVADAGIDQVLNCGNATALLGGPGTSTGAGITYTWNNTSGNATKLVNQAGTYILGVSTDKGCLDADSVLVNGDFAAPTALVNATGNELTCTTGSQTLDGTASTSGVTYNWTLNGNTLGNNGSLVVNNPGCYQLVVSDSQNACTASTTFCVTQNNTPPVALIAPPAQLTCQTLDAQLDASATSGAVGLQFNWSGGGIVSGGSAPICTANAPGVYTLLVSNPLNGCTDEAEVTLGQDISLPTVNAQAAGTLDCNTSTTALNSAGSSTGAHFIYTWSSSNGVLNGPVDLLTAVAAAPGIYNLNITNELTGCSENDTTEVISLSGDPSAVTVTLQQPHCFGDCSGIVSLDDGGKGLLYSFDNQGFDTKNSYPSLCAGTYPLRTQDAYGCEWDTLLVIQSPLALQLSLGPDVQIRLGDSVQLAASLTHPVVKIDWVPAIDANCPPPCLGPWVYPLQTSTYKATAVDDQGCISSDQITIIVKKGQAVYIPNIFSPNGDGDNDVFMVFASGAVSVVRTFRVFDRWGEMVFERLHPQPGIPKDGWDGKIRQQESVPGVFVYVVEVEYVDGTTEVISGDVTLVR